MDELPILESREKEVPRWVQVSVGLLLGLLTLLCGFASVTLLFAPNDKSPILTLTVGLVLLLACMWVLEKCFRLLFGRKNRGGLMTPKTLRVVSFFFLVLPVAGLFTGYYRKMGPVAIFQAVMYFVSFLGLRTLARKREVMGEIDSLNPLARRAWTALVTTHPEWAELFGTRGTDDLEVAIPAPVGSKAGQLVVFSSKGRDLWVRFSQPSMCYSVDNEAEMLDVIQKILAETALFAVVMRGDEWAGTTLIRRGELTDVPQLGPNEAAHIVSWSGNYDRTIESGSQE